MTTTATIKSKTENGNGYEVVCGKVTVTVYFFSHAINVCVQNASAKVWSRGLGGRMFTSLAEALKAFKSESAKECILAVAAERMVVA